MQQDLFVLWLPLYQWKTCAFYVHMNTLSPFGYAVDYWQDNPLTVRLHARLSPSLQAPRACINKFEMLYTAYLYGHHCNSRWDIRKRSSNHASFLHLLESFVHTFVHLPHLPCPCDTSPSCCLVTSQHRCVCRHQLLPLPLAQNTERQSKIGWDFLLSNSDRQNKFWVNAESLVRG